WLTRRAEQLHLLAVFAYRAFSAQAAIVWQCESQICSHGPACQTAAQWRRLVARRRQQPAVPLATRRCMILTRRGFSFVQDLFEEPQDTETANTTAPLATRMRPRSLEEFVGQEHILAPGKLLRRAIEADRLPSVIFSGPPGSGKTTLARVIAEMTHAKF